MSAAKSAGYEASLDKDIVRIYSRYPSLQGNVDVLRMLDEIEEKTDAAHTQGEESGYQDCVDEWLTPLVEALKADPRNEEEIKEILSGIERDNIL
jgi:hypothetical protein